MGDRLFSDLPPVFIIGGIVAVVAQTLIGGIMMDLAGSALEGQSEAEPENSTLVDANRSETEVQTETSGGKYGDGSSADAVNDDSGTDEGGVGSDGGGVGGRASDLNAVGTGASAAEDGATSGSSTVILENERTDGETDTSIVASIRTNRTNITEGGSVEFKAVPGKDQELTRTFWRFGDGDTSTSSTTVHSYQVSGRYTVNLAAENSSGRTTTDSVSVEVIDGGGDEGEADEEAQNQSGDGDTGKDDSETQGDVGTSNVSSAATVQGSTQGLGNGSSVTTGSDTETDITTDVGEVEIRYSTLSPKTGWKQRYSIQSKLDTGYKVGQIQWLVDGEKVDGNWVMTHTFDESGEHDVKVRVKLRRGGYVEDEVTVDVKS
ncbi:MAG: PKD domain-containing protein [Halobacteria archaeon]